MSSKKTIVVVGGGAGGATASVALSKSLPPNVELILINPRPYRISLPASLRLVVSNTDNLDNPATGALVPYDKIFSGNPNARFVHASVTTVIPSEGKGKGKVVLNTNEQLEYDVLILATGSKWGGAIDFPEGDEKALMDYINSRREEFKNAKEILIVGGGSVGIELAGEIKDIWPSKPITILQRDSKLLNSVYPDRFRDRLATQMKARGVNLVFEDALDIDSEARITTLGEGGGELQTFKTKGGREVKADLVIRSFGSKPNTSFLPSSFLTTTGTLQVLPTLQLPGYANIFALGDIIDWKEQKQAAKVALGHAGIVVHNVLEVLKETDPSAMKLKEYKGSTEMILVTNGKSKGLGYVDLLWGIVLPSWVAAMLKSKTLMLAKDRAGTGN